MKSNSIAGLVVTGCLAAWWLLTPAAARADFTALTDASQISDPKTVVDFEGVATGFLTDPNVLAAQGIVFPNADDLPADLFVQFDGDNVLLSILNGDVLIDFVNPVRAAGIDYDKDSGQSLTFTAYEQLGGGGAVVGTAPSALDMGFFGVDGKGTLIRSVRVTDDNGSFNVDNLTFAAPLPGAAVLGTMGLGLVGWMKRRSS